MKHCEEMEDLSFLHTDLTQLSARRPYFCTQTLLSFLHADLTRTTLYTLSLLRMISTTSSGSLLHSPPALLPPPWINLTSLRFLFHGIT
eukprot:c7823_g1_i1 orf=1-264(-)